MAKLATFALLAALCALPAFGDEILTVWYDGCGANSSYAGEHLRSCSGGTTQSGNQYGHWKWVSKYHCTTGVITNFYYEFCDGAYQPVSEQDFLGACTCDGYTRLYYTCGSGDTNQVGAEVSPCDGNGAYTSGTQGSAKYEQAYDCDTGNLLYSRWYIWCGGWMWVSDNNSCPC